MESRDRDRVGQRTSPTDAGQINRETSEELGRRNSGSGVEFGQGIGRSENLNEGGEMKRNRNESGSEGIDREREQSRNPGSSGYGSSTGRSGSVGNMGGGGSDVSRSEQGSRRGSSDEFGRTGSSGLSRDSNIDDSSEGRH